MSPEDEMAEFLDGYADACADVGAEPLPISALAELAEMLVAVTGPT